MVWLLFLANPKLYTFFYLTRRSLAYEHTFLRTLSKFVTLALFSNLHLSYSILFISLFFFCTQLWLKDIFSKSTVICKRIYNLLFIISIFLSWIIFFLSFNPKLEINHAKHIQSIFNMLYGENTNIFSRSTDLISRKYLSTWIVSKLIYYNLRTIFC